MPAPYVGVYLQTPIPGWTALPLSDYISLESAPEITEAIESPAESNMFVAPDVTLKVYDNPKTPTLIPLFEQITPTSLDWRLTIDCDGWQRFSGYILPNTVQIDDIERWVSFTAVGLAAKLAATSAETSALKRTVNAGWRVYAAPTPSYNAVIEIDNSAGARASCEIVSGDTVTLTTAGGATEDVLVQWVAPVGAASPYATFQIGVLRLEQSFAVGTPVTLATPYVRNVSLKYAVDQLYVAAGLSATTASTYLVAPISGSSEPFASVPSHVGLVGAPLAIAPNPSNIFGFDGTRAICGTSNAVYVQEDPPLGDWTYTAGDPVGANARPVDWSPQGSGKYILYGPRFEVDVYAADTLEYRFYGYDYRPVNRPATAYRYVLAITVDNLAELSATFSWTAQLRRERSTDLYTWVADAGPWGATSGGTTTNLHDELEETCGIDVSVSQGVVYWTTPTGASGTTNYRLSSFVIASSTVTASVVAGRRGKVFCPEYDVVGVFQRDTIRGNAPTAFFYQPTAAGGATLLSSSPIDAGFVGETIRRNLGDGYWYALSSSVGGGVQLLSFTSSQLATRTGWVPVQILAPNSPGNSVGLAVIRSLSWVGGPFPMMVIAGNQLWWISFEFAGIIPYCDVEGLSCAEALAQLATLVDAFFYVDRLGTTWFRSRNVSSAKTIGTGRTITSARIDDSECLSLRRAGIWYKTVRHVTVTNEDDETITGSAGDPDFIGNEMAITITNRFVYPQSFALALAEHLYAYLGRALRAVDIEHVDDARNYSVGNGFDVLLGGVLTRFQVIEGTHRLSASTVRVQGIEM